MPCYFLLSFSFICYESKQEGNFDPKNMFQIKLAFKRMMFANLISINVAEWKRSFHITFQLALLLYILK